MYGWIAKQLRGGTPTPSEKGLDAVERFQQCQDEYNRQFVAYRKLLDTVETQEELEKIKQQAPNHDTIPQCQGVFKT